MQAAEDDELGALIRSEAERHVAPAGLAARIRADLQRMGDQAAVRPSVTEPPVMEPPATQPPVTQPGVAKPPVAVDPAPARPAPARADRPLSSTPWRWLQALGLFGAGAATAWGLVFALLLAPQQQAERDALTDTVADAHVRSLLASHLADVASTDQHTVKPWFAGKLDFSPPVVDLAAEGMPLTGGRLDFLGGREVAALVYRAGPHVVNLFIWPQADAKPLPPQLLERRGYNLVHWTQDGFQAWAVSDLNAAELQAFAGLARTRIAEVDSGATPTPR